MRYGYVSRKSKQAVKKHIEALQPYGLSEIIVDDFESEVDIQLERLRAGDSLYIEEPPRDIQKFARIHSYTRKNGITLYVKGNPMPEIPVIEMFEELVKIETAKRIGYSR